MILKGSQRGGGNGLAAHLMNVADNEHVLVHELRGFSASDLKGAFKEAEAVSLGTKCNQYLFSLVLSPPEKESVPVEVFEKTIGRVEEKLGLIGQPRAIVFHEKDGRRHAHCVWSRIDADRMTAKQLSHSKLKLMDISRALYLEHGWKMPRGFENAAERNPTNFTLAEWQQAKRQKIDPRWLKQCVQDCWSSSDDRRSLERSLDERGFFLAKGDKRSVVVLDHGGEVYSLPRLLGRTTKEVRERIDEGALRSVGDIKKLIGERMTPAIRGHIAESRGKFAERSATLGQFKAELTQLHRDARTKLATKQANEWERETRERAERLPTGLRGLWHKITGRYSEIRKANELEASLTLARHSNERQSLIEKQLAQRSVLQTEFKKLRSAQAEELLSLRADIGRFLKLQRQIEPPALSRGRGLGLRLER